MHFDFTVLVDIALAFWFMVDGIYMVMNKRFRNAKANAPYTAESLDKGIPIIGVCYVIASLLLLLGCLALIGIFPQHFLWIFCGVAVVIILAVYFIVRAAVLKKQPTE